MYWLEVSVATDGEGAEAVAEALRPFAHQDGVVLEQMGDAASPNLDALEQAVTVKIYIPGQQDTPELRQRIDVTLYHLGRLYPLPSPVYREIKDQDWAHAWKANYHPLRVGQKIRIRPSWIDSPSAEVQPDNFPTEDVEIVLDPGMAFGTGSHPTTQMCLMVLERLVRAGKQVLDVGTGSGILSIAAAKLGASKVLGIDTDETAVKVARANVLQNNVQARVILRSGRLETVEHKSWDVVAVNILAPIIVNLLEEDHLLDYVAADGSLVLSGILETQAESVRAAVGDCGGTIVRMLANGDWVAFIVEHIPNS